MKLKHKNFNYKHSKKIEFKRSFLNDLKKRFGNYSSNKRVNLKSKRKFYKYKKRYKNVKNVHRYNGKILYRMGITNSKFWSYQFSRIYNLKKIKRYKQIKDIEIYFKNDKHPYDFKILLGKKEGLKFLGFSFLTNRDKFQFKNKKKSVFLKDFLEAILKL